MLVVIRFYITVKNIFVFKGIYEKVISCNSAFNGIIIYCKQCFCAELGWYLDYSPAGC